MELLEDDELDPRHWEMAGLVIWLKTTHAIPTTRSHKQESL